MSSTQPTPNVLIFGTGGVGCVYGYILSAAGCTVTTVCRTNYSAVKAHGISIRSKIFGRVHFHPKAVQTCAEAATHGPFDYIIACNKAFPGSSALLKDAITAESTIVLAQNGIGTEDEYTAAYPTNTLISGVVYLPVTQVSPGVVEMGPLERFEIGTYPPSAPTDKATQLASLWAAGGATAAVYPDIQPQRWIKVAVNASWNPVCALTLCDDANFLRSSAEAEDMALRLMRLVGRIAREALGYDVVTEEVIQRQMQRHRDRLETGGKEPSMLTDVRMGRGLEVEAILGNTVRIARGLGLQDEVRELEVLYVLAKGLDFAIRSPDEWKGIARHD